MFHTARHNAELPGANLHHAVSQTHVQDAAMNQEEFIL